MPPSRRSRARRSPVSDELWNRSRPLLPVIRRRHRWPGRKRMDDRACLNGIPFVLVTGIGWERYEVAVHRQL